MLRKCKLKACICKGFFCLFLNLLPGRMKRILFISSLLPKILGDELNDKQYRAVNTLLNLSVNDNALYFGVKISKFIWEVTDVNNIDWKDFVNLTHKKIHKFRNMKPVKTILTATPEPLKYDKDKMVSDLMVLSDNTAAIRNCAS